LANDERIEQVLRLLLNNAIKLTPDRGGDKLRTRANEKGLIISVKTMNNQQFWRDKKPTI
jgi:signal transduction histidine kinase